MPGWIDMHVHLEGETSPTAYLEEFTLNDADVAYNAEVFAKTTLLSGFTTVRDLGGSGVNVSLRNAINADPYNRPKKNKTYNEELYSSSFLTLYSP